MSDRGVLTVISGFSGAGKGTVVKQLLVDLSDNPITAGGGAGW